MLAWRWPWFCARAAAMWRCRALATQGHKLLTRVLTTRRDAAQGIVVVPQQQAYVVERWGKFERVLEPGLNLLVPFMHRIAYVHSLKVLTIDIGNQVRACARGPVACDSHSTPL